MHRFSVLKLKSGAFSFCVLKTYYLPVFEVHFVMSIVVNLNFFNHGYLSITCVSIIFIYTIFSLYNLY